MHLVVEATGKEALARGMKSVRMRLARAVNRVFGRRGPVLSGRYHLRVLRTPREVRNALAYVLLNVRKHWQGGEARAPPVRLDVASSGGRSMAGGDHRGSPSRQRRLSVAPARIGS